MKDYNANNRGESSDNRKLNDLIDCMILAQTHLGTFKDPESTIRVYSAELGEIYSQFDGKILTVTSDNIILPIVEDSGDITGSQMSAGATTGRFDSISAGFISMTEDSEPEPFLGIKLYMGADEYSSVIGNKKYEYFAFVPFAGASIHISEDVLDDFEPASNDEICHSIDEALLNETISLPKLMEIFENSIKPEIDEDGDPIVSLQHEVYLKYLNKLSAFNHVVAFADFGISRTNLGVKLYGSNGEGYILEGAFSGFDLFSINIDGEYRIKFAISAIDKYGEMSSVLVNGISEIELR